MIMLDPEASWLMYTIDGDSKSFRQHAGTKTSREEE
jgi:hypothetical protein